MKQGKLTGKLALVTGASRGLGKAIAIELASEGAHAVLVGRDVEKLEEVSQQIRSSGGLATPFTADVSKEESVRDLEQRVLSSVGEISILVNNAGINIRKPMTDYSLEEWYRVLDTNLTSVFLMCRSFVPQMKGKGYGRVINIGSIMSWISLPGRGAYTASKGGMLAVTRTLALELATESITVNAISPGLIRTEMNTALLDNPEVYRDLTSRIPVARWGTPEEVGKLAAYLSGPESAFVTGTDVVIDGGWCAQ
jgi:NAD(P)-dependent dehydrogenase (short-subunit alcohol dehydrogenase family)